MGSSMTCCILLVPLLAALLGLWVPVVAVTPLAACTWTSNSENNRAAWEDGLNWSCGHVPNSGDDVTIGPVVAPRASPDLGTVTTVKSVTIQPGGYLDIGYSGGLSTSAGIALQGMLETRGPVPSAINVTGATAEIGGAFSGPITIFTGAHLIVGVSLNMLEASGDFIIQSGAVLGGINQYTAVYYSGLNLQNHGTITVANLYIDRHYNTSADQQTLGGQGAWTPSAGLYIGDNTKAPRVRIQNAMTWQTPTIAVDFGELIVPVSRTLTLQGTTSGTPAHFAVSGDTAVRRQTGASIHTRGAIELETRGTWEPPIFVENGTTGIGGVFDGAIETATGATLRVGTSLNRADLTNDFTLHTGAVLSGDDANSTLHHSGLNFRNDGTITLANLYFDRHYNVDADRQMLRGTGVWAPSQRLQIGSDSNAPHVWVMDSMTWQVPSLAIDDGELMAPVSRTLTLQGATSGAAAHFGVSAGAAVRRQMAGAIHTRGAIQLETRGTWEAPVVVENGTTEIGGAYDGAIEVQPGAALRAGTSLNRVDLTGDLTLHTGATLSGQDQNASFHHTGANFQNDGTITVASLYFERHYKTLADRQVLRGQGAWRPRLLLQVGDGGNAPQVFIQQSMTWQAPFVYVTDGELQVPISRTLTIQGTTSGNPLALGVSGAAAVTGGGFAHTKNHVDIEIRGAWGAGLAVDNSVTSAWGVVDGPVSVAAGATLTVLDGYRLTLNQDAQVDGLLLIEPYGDVDGSGEIVGAVQRTGIMADRTYTFNGANVRLRFTSAGQTATTPTAVTVTMQRSAPNTPGPAVRRTYSIAPVGDGGYEAILRLQYRDGELNGLDENDLHLLRYDATKQRWINRGRTGANTDDNWVELIGVTQFSTWSIGNDASVAYRLTFLPMLARGQ